MARRDAIIAAIETQADWRRQKAAEYTDDSRNTRAVEGLEDLVVYVKSLPEDDPRIVELWSLWKVDDKFCSPGADAERAISQFRFRNPHDECSAFLSSLVRIATEDAMQLAERSGRFDV